MRYDFSDLGEQRFQSLCQVLASDVLGESFQAFGEGKDGGRDGTFHGPIPYPSAPDRPWSGYGVLQVKYMHGHPDTKSGTSWLKRQVTIELEEWLAPDKDRVVYGQIPEYLIFASNVPLSPVPGKGGFDTIDALIESYRKRLSLKDWRIWDYSQICTYVSRSASVRDAFGLTTQGDVLASLNHQLNRHPRPGEGVPWCSNAFQEAYDLCGGEDMLGNAIDVAHEYGPGHVQHFYNGKTSRRYAICCLGNGPAVAIPAKAWDALCRLGNSPSSTGGPTGAGYPVSPEGPAAYLDKIPSALSLQGGTWGAGSMTRLTDDVWAWQPKLTMTYNASRERTVWTSGTDSMDVRLRLVARSHVAPDGLTIARSGRQRLQAALNDSPFITSAIRWAATRGLSAQQPRWHIAAEPAGRNDNRTACYQFVIPGHQAKPALIGSARLALPDEANSALLAIIDLRIAFDAISPSVQHTFPAQIPDRLRITTNDLHIFFCSGWPILASLLIGATEDLTSIVPNGLSSLEFHISSERTDNAANIRSIRLEDVVDLSAFGACTRSLPNDISVGLTASIIPQTEDLLETSMQVLLFLAGGYGFIDVEAEELAASLHPAKLNEARTPEFPGA